MGLGAATEQMHKMDVKRSSNGVSICPGPNMAYFSKIMTLKEIADHIYGRINVISSNKRPNMFIKELKLYSDHLMAKIDDIQGDLNKRQEKSLLSFSENLQNGITYYKNLFNQSSDRFEASKLQILAELQLYTGQLENMQKKISKLSLATQTA